MIRRKHNMKYFDEYDLNKLKKARTLLNEVWEYNYSSDNLEKRLWTIISKLDAIIDLHLQKERK